MPPDDIDTRLAALEARAPGRRSARADATAAVAPVRDPPRHRLRPGPRHGRLGCRRRSRRGDPRPGHRGVQNPGQPLEGAKLECMSPPEAAAYLAERGFTDVVWQVESGVAGEKSGALRPAGRRRPSTAT